MHATGLDLVLLSCARRASHFGTKSSSVEAPARQEVGRDET